MTIKPAFMRPAGTPRSRSAKGLADFARERVERCRRALLDISLVYSDVDQSVVSDCERLMDEQLAELLATIQGAQEEGRDGL